MLVKRCDTLEQVMKEVERTHHSVPIGFVSEGDLDLFNRRYPNHELCTAKKPEPGEFRPVYPKRLVVLDVKKVDLALLYFHTGWYFTPIIKASEEDIERHIRQRAMLLNHGIDMFADLKCI